MIKKIFFFALLILVSCKQGSNANTAFQQKLGTKLMSAQSIKVMTFNIRYGTADDGLNKWELRRNAVLKTLTQNNYDFLLLQEVLPSQMNEILQEKTIKRDYGSIYRTRDENPKTGEGSPILFNTKRWKKLQGGVFWFSDTPTIPGSITWNNRWNLPRIATWGTFEDKLSAKKVIVFSTHYDYDNNFGQVNASNQILRYAASTGLPAIIGGDFNVTETTEPYFIFTQNGFTDTWRAWNTENITTFHNFQGTTVGDRIDFIFADESKFNILGGKIHTEKVDGRYASDHYAVSAELILR